MIPSMGVIGVTDGAVVSLCSCTGGEDDKGNSWVPCSEKLPVKHQEHFVNILRRHYCSSQVFLVHTRPKDGGQHF